MCQLCKHSFNRVVYMMSWFISLLCVFLYYIETGMNRLVSGLNRIGTLLIFSLLFVHYSTTDVYIG